ncbi:Rv3235 family protein [Arthrobacter sp. N1]|uniref:Rv3235 family protein n=1 Tax=Arthrobacter sp. N1 TaxID=619291 RepID=UPI003BAEF3E3
MPAVTQLHRTADHHLAEVSGAPRPLVARPPGPPASGGATVLPFTPTDGAGADRAADPARPAPAGRALPVPAITDADADREIVQRISGIARSVAQGALEVLIGVRPLQQMSRWLDPENYERLHLRANLVRCIGAASGSSGSPTGTGVRQVVVRSARVCPISPGVYEASVVAFDRTRVRAVALRIEQRRGVWRVTALEIG